ncbi:MAG: toxin-antitoxin system YwqK family antitoxin [Bacteroidia bacterium]
MKLFYLFSFISFMSFAQKQDTIYYNHLWKNSPQNEAFFYKVYTTNDSNEIIGLVHDYFITGELQWSGNMSHIDKLDNEKDVDFGLCTWYHKNGKKSSQVNKIDGKSTGIETYWDENGNKIKEEEYKMGLLDGKVITYSINGLVKTETDYISGYQDGKLKSKH